ncbi:hypothetical protein [Methanogenium cariaci]|uniref:hypothetical protein n=1 Tax=Methanogenium cariaci TaxID=2197 RepID=UPI001FDF9FCF|nr:hypothetical protein [Methanogenium cariaci]
MTSGVFGPKKSQRQTLSFASISDMGMRSSSVTYEKLRPGEVQVVCIGVVVYAGMGGEKGLVVYCVYSRGMNLK